MYVQGVHFSLSLLQSPHKGNTEDWSTNRSGCLQPHTELFTVSMPADLSGRVFVFTVLQMLTALYNKQILL